MYMHITQQIIINHSPHFSLLTPHPPPSFPPPFSKKKSESQQNKNPSVNSTENSANGSRFSVLSMLSGDSSVFRRKKPSMSSTAENPHVSGGEDSEYVANEDGEFGFVCMYHIYRGGFLVLMLCKAFVHELKTIYYLWLYNQHIDLYLLFAGAPSSPEQD
ncbi:hypothetical protein EON65_01620 [archaeon]|nr:MAG: hypothetical protein EON65_01620 [archaeon]